MRTCTKAYGKKSKLLAHLTNWKHALSCIVLQLRLINQLKNDIIKDSADRDTVVAPETALEIWICSITMCVLLMYSQMNTNGLQFNFSVVLVTSCCHTTSYSYIYNRHSNDNTAFIHDRQIVPFFFPLSIVKTHILRKRCQDVKSVLMLYSLITIYSVQFIQQPLLLFEVVFQWCLADASGERLSR